MNLIELPKLRSFENLITPEILQLVQQVLNSIHFYSNYHANTLNPAIDLELFLPISNTEPYINIVSIDYEQVANSYNQTAGEVNKELATTYIKPIDYQILLILKGIFNLLDLDFQIRRSGVYIETLSNITVNTGIIKSTIQSLKSQGLNVRPDIDKKYNYSGKYPKSNERHTEDTLASLFHHAYLFLDTYRYRINSYFASLTVPPIGAIQNSANIKKLLNTFKKSLSTSVRAFVIQNTSGVELELLSKINNDANEDITSTNQEIRISGYLAKFRIALKVAMDSKTQPAPAETIQNNTLTGLDNFDTIGIIKQIMKEAKFTPMYQYIFIAKVILILENQIAWLKVGNHGHIEAIKATIIPQISKINNTIGELPKELTSITTINDNTDRLLKSLLSVVWQCIDLQGKLEIGYKILQLISETFSLVLFYDVREFCFNNGKTLDLDLYFASFFKQIDTIELTNTNLPVQRSKLVTAYCAVNTKNEERLNLLRLYLINLKSLKIDDPEDTEKQHFCLEFENGQLLKDYDTYIKNSNQFLIIGNSNKYAEDLYTKNYHAGVDLFKASLRSFYNYISVKIKDVPTINDITSDFDTKNPYYKEMISKKIKDKYFGIMAYYFSQFDINYCILLRRVKALKKNYIYQLDADSKVYRNLALASGSFLIEIIEILEQLEVEYNFTSEVKFLVHNIINPNDIFNVDGDWGTGSNDPIPTRDPTPRPPVAA